MDTTAARDGTRILATAGGRDGAGMRRIVGFSAACLGLIALVMLVVWVMGAFEGGNLSVQGWIALTLGTVLTSALGVALMALVFYSDRSGRDEDVGGDGREPGR